MFVSNFSRGAREEDEVASHDSSRAPHTTANELWNITRVVERTIYVHGGPGGG